MMTHIHSVMDYEGLIRGEGEWKNMQEIICRTFRILVDQNQQQGEAIHRLEKQVSMMKEEINHRPSWDDVDRLIEARILSDKKKNTKFTSEVDQLKIQVAHLKSDLEKKVSISYLDMSLNKKMDRSEALIKSAGTSYKGGSGTDTTDEDIKKLKLDLLQVKADLENLSDMVGSTFQSFDIARIASDVSILKSQSDHFTHQMKQVYTKEEIAVMLLQKASKSEVEVQVSQKADSITFSKSIQRIEQALEQHEKLITSLRFRSNDNMLFSSHLNPLVGDTSRRGEGTQFELENNLKNGRLESIVIEMWNNLNGVQSEMKIARKDLNYVADAVNALKQVLEKSAHVEKVELLAVVVEEQRQRIDAIIQGTTKIAPLFKTLSRFEDQLKEINEFLSLPQPKSLVLLLDEIRFRVHELKDEVTISREFYESEAKQRVDALTYQTESLETRWRTAQNDREKLDFILDAISMSGTGYTSIREMVEHFLEIRTLITGDGVASEIGSLSILPRLHKFESRLQSQERHLEKYKLKMRNLKTALLSLEAYASAKDKGFVGKIIQKDKVDRDEFSSPPPAPHPNVEESEIPQTEEKPNVDESLNEPTNAPIHVHSTPPRSTVVDFDAALSQLLTSIDDIKIPVRRNVTSGTHTAPISLDEVDQRLNELSHEKKRLRKILLSQT